MPIRTAFKQISNQLTKLWNPGNYYYAKQQEVCKEKFKLFETIKTSKNICDDFFRDSTKRRLEILDGKIDNYSNKWNETKIRTSSKQRKKLTTQQDNLRWDDLDFKTLNNSLSWLNDTKKQKISNYLSSVSESITKHIDLIDKQLDLQKTQQENKGLDSPEMKKRFKDIIKNESDIYNEAFKKPENVQMLKNQKNVQISSAEKNPTVKRITSL